MQAQINLAGELRITPATETEKYAVLMFVMNSQSKLKSRVEGGTLFVLREESEISRAVSQVLGRDNG